MISSNDCTAIESIMCRTERGSPMISVLICDDDYLFLNTLTDLVTEAFRKMNVKVKVRSYSNAEDIGKPILNSCDIALLDVEFNVKKYTGLDIARQLRSVRPDAVIIFVTNYISYAVAGYEVRAFRYLLKEEVTQRLENYLRAALDEISLRRETMKFSVNGEVIDVPLDNILYIESEGHMVVVYTVSVSKKQSAKQYRYYASLQKVEEQLVARGFLRIHKSFLANMKHIQKLQYSEATLYNGDVLPVSERNYSTLKSKYLIWKGK